MTRRRARGPAPIWVALLGAVVLIGSAHAPAGAQVTPAPGDPQSAPGFAILPAPWEVSDASLPDVFERYVDALKDPRALGGWPGTSCGGATDIPCERSYDLCVRDLKWGCPDDLFLDLFLPAFRELLARMPEDRFATGQGVYHFIGLGRTEEAAGIAERCAVSESWCSMLDAVVAYDQGRWEDARASFLSSFEEMPEEDLCAVTDLHWLFIRAGDFLELECSERGPTNERIWWLSDPLWSEPGNPRQLAHWNRLALTILHDDFLELETRPGAVVDNEGHPLSHHASTTPYGMDRPDGTSPDPARGGAWLPGTSRAAQFVPAWEAVADPFRARPDHWDLAPERPWELFEDPGWDRFVEVPQQVAAFERGGMLAVAAATDLSFELRFAMGPGTRAAFVLSPGPGAFEVVHDSLPRRRYAFLDTVPAGEYVASIEVMEDGARLAGRVRRGITLPEGPDQSVRISDLLVFELPDPEFFPEALEDVLPRMLGREWVPPDAQIGIYWELYGATASEPVSVEVTARPERSFLGRIGRWFGIGREDLVVGWTEGADPGPEGITARSVGLDLGRLDPGRYAVQLQVTVAGQLPVVTTRPLEIR